MVTSGALVRVSVIVPTWNERDNIVSLLQTIHLALGSQEYEVVVVDDASPDGTAQEVEVYKQVHLNRRVVLVRRAGKGGLAGAVLEGAAVAQGKYLVMMDADLSHDPWAIPSMLQMLDKGYHAVVGSRYVGAESGIQGWSWRRRFASCLAIGVARLFLRLGVRDLTSGFAAFHVRYLVDLPTRFSARGFKLLLEVLVVWPDLWVVEHPITFIDRSQGKSKFGVREILEFGRLCLRLWWYRLRHCKALRWKSL